MKPAFLNVALIGRYNSPQIAQSLTRLARFLQSHGTTVLVEAETARNIGVDEFGAADYAGIGAKADLAVVLGGDGTMLNAARSLARSGVPLVGINQGHLGFMTDIALDAMLDSMTAVLNGVYSMEERSMIDASIVRGGQTLHQGLALNDVVVNKGATGQMIQFRVHIDQQFVYDQSSDGLIIATPTGSTAYALSANGPILHPALAGFTLVPICPHALTNRPIAVSDQSEIEIVLEHARDARVHCDGQSRFDLCEGDKIIIRRSQYTIRFLHPQGYNYYAMLRQKLHWSESLGI